MLNIPYLVHPPRSIIEQEREHGEGDETEMIAEQPMMNAHDLMQRPGRL